MAGAIDLSGFNDNQDGMADLMTMPMSITVDEQEESPPRSQQRSGDSMTVPERIIINGDRGGYLASKDEIPREMKNEFVPNMFMGGMSTPPRTLTVDDTTSAHYPATKSTSKPNVSLKERRIKHDEQTDVDEESIRTGLEIINEVNPLQSDSEESFAHEYEVVDLRKSVVKLNRRVAMLEREMSQNTTFGFWSKLLLFTFTFINPMILSWLLGGRRR